MERGALKGHGALLLANVIWGLNSPICKTILPIVIVPLG